MSCLDESTIARLVSGQIPPAEAAALEEHLDSCSDCRSLLVAAARVADSTSVSGAGASRTQTPWGLSEEPGLPRQLLLPGDLVGRYRIEEPIGSGGMGTVYAARDPELGRRVAIKMLRGDVFGRGREVEGSQRLRREAQALASLSHPNIVAVYDVGVHRGQVFVAMELVEGQSLSRWLRDGRRNWREVRDVLLEAGQGLAAAHAAGLIHRDFKPDNVLVGEDGRIRVTDFGLARSASGTDDPVSSAGLSLASQMRVDPLITRPGATVGTPAYMAPEQHQGVVTDERTDQFAFCVALFEGLYGQRPFLGDTAEEISREVLSGTRPVVPEDSRVPRWLARIVERGLRRDPDKRYPSMNALLADLAYDPAQVWRRATLAGSVLAVIAAIVAVGWALTSRGTDPCKSIIARRLSGVWDRARERVVHRAFTATGKPFARQSSRVVTGALDRYSRRWVAARRAACENLRTAPGAEVAARRVQCLENRFAELREVVDAFTLADAKTVERAIVTVHGMGSLRNCADPRRLPPPEPEDKATRDKVRKVRATLARSRILFDSGKYKASRALAEKAVEMSKTVAFQAASAEAWYRLAEVQQRQRKGADAVRSLRECLIAAEASRHDEFVARARTLLVWAVGALQEKTAEVGLLAREARAALTRIGGDAAIEARLLSILSSINGRAHRYASAVRYAERSLALSERLYGADHAMVTMPLESLAIALGRAGRYRDALPHFRRVLEVRLRQLGPRHPLVSSAYTNLGIVYRHLGKLRLSVAALEKAAVISRATVGSNRLPLASDLHNLGNTLLDLGEASRALDAYREALAIRRRELPEGHGRTTMTLAGVANAALDLGRVDEAARTQRQVIAAMEKARGPKHVSVAVALTNLAAAELRRGRHDAARPALDRALRIFSSTGRERPEAASVFFLQGQIARKEGKRRQALEHFRRALALRRRAHGDDHWRVGELMVWIATLRGELGERRGELRKMVTRALAIVGRAAGRAASIVSARARFLLAQTDWDQGGDRADAVARARRIAASLGGSGRAAALRAEVARWLARRDVRKAPSSK